MMEVLANFTDYIEKGKYITIYIILPIIISLIYVYAEKKNTKRTISIYNLLKGILYFYSVIALIFGNSAQQYITGLAITIGIFEGTSAFYNGIKLLKKN